VETLEPLIAMYENISFVLTHMADGNVKDVLRLSRTYKNVYFDTSIVISGYPPIRETNKPSWLDDSIPEGGEEKKYFRRKCHEIVPKHSIQLNFNLPEIYSFLPTVFQIGDVSFVRLKEVTLILISGLFPILASTAAVSTATRASSSERLPVGFTVLSETVVKSAEDWLLSDAEEFDFLLFIYANKAIMTTSTARDTK